MEERISAIEDRNLAINQEEDIWAAQFPLETSWSLLTCLIPLHLQSFISSVFTELGTIATHSVFSDTLTPLWSIQPV